MNNWKKTLEKKIEIYARIGKDANWAKIRYIRELANKLAIRGYKGFDYTVKMIDSGIENDIVTKDFADEVTRNFMGWCDDNDIEITLDGDE